MPKLSIPTEFSIDFVGGLTKVNDLISKVRARIYYKYGNRNGTWITDEFAEKLNQTLPHVPIVGTYDVENDDFTNHSDKGQKKAYGFVPNDPNISWEQDEESGKDYLAADVYLWTGYWPEAAKIINKSQSMEILRESIVGDWKVVGGDYYFVYQSGSFKGLCALGDTVMPAFEKSAFYSLDEESRSFFASLSEINGEKEEGGNTMPEDVKVDEFEAVVETPVVEETPVETPAVEEFSTEENQTEEFEKITSTVQAIVVSTVEEEGGYKSTTVEQSERTTITEYPEPDKEEVCSYTAEDYNARVSEIQTLNARIVEFEAKIANLTAEVERLSVYQVAAIKNEKLAVIENFKRKLSEEEVSPFVESLDNYTTDELRTKLSVILAEKALAEVPEISQPQTDFVSVSAVGSPENGTVKLLKKYKK